MATKKKARLEHKGTTYRTAREAVKAQAPKGRIADAFGMTTVEVDGLRIEEGLMPKTSPMAKWVMARLERDRQPRRVCLVTTPTSQAPVLRRLWCVFPPANSFPTGRR